MRSTIRGNCLVSYGMVRNAYGIPEVRYSVSVPGLKLEGPFLGPGDVIANVTSQLVPALLHDPAGPRVDDYANVLMALADFWPPSYEDSIRIAKDLYELKTRVDTQKQRA